MELASIIHQYYNAFISKYGDTVLPGHLKAMNAIRCCRTPDSGELYVQCPDCNHAEWRPLSCGHRSCPKCQNHEASQWIDRQQGKLLPVPYFMVTFTLPYELRSLTWHHQRKMYSIFFICVSSTLKDFGLNPKNLGAEIGMTMVLHTHTENSIFTLIFMSWCPAAVLINKDANGERKRENTCLMNLPWQKSFAPVFLQL